MVIVSKSLYVECCDHEIVDYAVTSLLCVRMSAVCVMIIPCTFTEIHDVFLYVILCVFSYRASACAWHAVRDGVWRFALTNNQPTLNTEIPVKKLTPRVPHYKVAEGNRNRRGSISYL